MTEALIRRLRTGWPFFILGLLTVVFALMLVFSRKAPLISLIEPSMATPGQTVVVTGDYFGHNAREGTLSISGEIPPPSLIQSWTDQKIVFVIPEDAVSGLVTVSNSQGTSTGVLFTNTQSIPTVMQGASAPAEPLIWSISPLQPNPSQTVSLSGRGLGTGDEAVWLVLSTGNGGPAYELRPQDCISWNKSSISFRLPQGVGPNTSVHLVTPRGETPEFPLPSSSVVTLDSPRTIDLIAHLRTGVAAQTAVSLWGPFPQALSGTRAVLSSSNPALSPSFKVPSFSWGAGDAGLRSANYTLRLTTWARHFNSMPAGSLPLGDGPGFDEVSRGLWKPVQSGLKSLASRWNLDVADPWLRVQRLQSGLSGAFKMSQIANESPVLSRPPADLLGAARLNSFESATLASALAAQAGLASRLVAGFELTPETVPLPRTWLEVWIPGAGWLSWDPIDGSPGNLDNRHFAFENVSIPPVRRLAKSKLLRPFAPATLGTASGEAAGPGSDPIVSWEFTATEK